MTPSVRTLKGSKTKGFRGSPLLCPRGSNARGFSNSIHCNNYKPKMIPKLGGLQLIVAI